MVSIGYYCLDCLVDTRWRCLYFSPYGDRFVVCRFYYVVGITHPTYFPSLPRCTW